MADVGLFIFILFTLIIDGVIAHYAIFKCKDPDIRYGLILLTAIYVIFIFTGLNIQNPAVAVFHK